MSQAERHPVRFLLTFFAVGTTIALGAGLYFQSRGESLGFSILFGAYLGGFGAWLIYFTCYRLASLWRRLRHTEHDASS